MIGGESEAFTATEPIWKDIAQAGGYVLAGPSGSGHFTKMVHNAIEYGMLQAYAEGMDLLKVAPLAGPIDLKGATSVWQQGSIIRSFIGGLVAEAIANEELVTTSSTSIAHTGEGLWAVQEGLQQGLSQPVFTAALQVRMASKAGLPLLGNKVISAVRYLFGGHAKN